MPNTPKRTSTTPQRRPKLQPATDSIAPTEFLKEWSATKPDRRFRVFKLATYMPQVEKTHALPRSLGADAGQGCPPRSVE
ncbi:predicted protein [Plenodomus lingam JN3]|uniref:Predicted protein n=1 Tax=Leptosphaeria maculans (strain JN3 / isolate v23.1.3 / race Av1-4-5-6-7-8) TaxID=985895 RepID=E4ZYF0_LEPMJ|nr:predicted protein [Plenodomus lingam JN3]CBX96395.1 predicted protein [Plenodomus lingam JN3]